jgi:branched-subunit amino acid aminotransferase/4-amino-4-deoxychorismate lyase
MNRQVHSSEIAWQDGKVLPRDQLSIAPSDAGFVLGATVTEQLRTFRGEIFLPDNHAIRLGKFTSRNRH